MNPLSLITYPFNFCFPLNPMTERRELGFIPLFIDRWIGECAFPYITPRGGILTVDDASYSKMVKRVDAVFNRLVTAYQEREAKMGVSSGFQWEVKILNTDEINAFALPGGKVGITKGIIDAMGQHTAKYDFPPCDLDEKIAAILSHEMMHVAMRHTVKTYRVSCAIFLLGFNISGAILGFQLSFLYEWITDQGLLVFSRREEFEADKWGMHLLADAYGVDKAQAAIWTRYFSKARFPEGHGEGLVVRLFHYLMSWFSTHPLADQRIEANKVTYEALKATRGGGSALQVAGV